MTSITSSNWPFLENFLLVLLDFLLGMKPSKISWLLLALLNIPRFGILYWPLEICKLVWKLAPNWRLAPKFTLLNIWRVNLDLFKQFQPQPSFLRLIPLVAVLLWRVQPKLIASQLWGIVSDIFSPCEFPTESLGGDWFPLPKSLRSFLWKGLF